MAEDSRHANQTRATPTFNYVNAINALHMARYFLTEGPLLMNKVGIVATRENSTILRQRRDSININNEPTLHYKARNFQPCRYASRY
jgi:hypothetical protein